MGRGAGGRESVRGENPADSPDKADTTQRTRCYSCEAAAGALAGRVSAEYGGLNFDGRMGGLLMSASKAAGYPAPERRAARRFKLRLPLLVRLPNEPSGAERAASTRNVSFRGIYFVFDGAAGNGDAIEFILTLPEELSRAGPGGSAAENLPGGPDPEVKAPEKPNVVAPGNEAGTQRTRSGQRIRGSGHIVRVEPMGQQAGVALRIERYEFLGGAQ